MPTTSTSNPLDWRIQEVSEWLRVSFSLSEETLRLFIENEVDGRVLLMNMDHGALKDEFLVKAFGKRAKILDAIASLRVVAKKQEVAQTPNSPRSFAVSTPSSILDMGGLRLSEDAPSIHQSLPETTRLQSIQSPRQREAFRRGNSPTDRDYAPIPLLDVPLKIWQGVAPNAQDQKALPSLGPQPQTRGQKPRRIQEKVDSDDDKGSVSLGSDEDDEEDEEDEDMDGGEYHGGSDEDPIPRNHCQDVDVFSNGEGARSHLNMDPPIVSHGYNKDNGAPHSSDSITPQASSSGKSAGEPEPVKSSIRRIAPTLVQAGLMYRPTDQAPSLVSMSLLGNIATPSSASLARGEDSNINKNYFLSAIESVRSRENEHGIEQSPITSTSSEFSALALSPSLSMDSNGPSKRLRNQRKKPYFEGGKLDLNEIYLGKDVSLTGSVEDEGDEVDDWAMVLNRSPQKLSLNPGRRHVVQKNMLRVLRDPPLFDIPGFTVYAPLRRGEKDVPVLLYPRTTTGNNDGKARRSTWDKTFPDPKKRTTTSRIELKINGEGMTSFDFSAVRNGNTREQPVTSGKVADPVLPLYGESDASAYTTDEELHKEVAREERDMARPPRSKRVVPHRAILSEPVIRATAEGYIADYKMQWEQRILPTLEKKRHHQYREAAKHNGLEDNLARSNAEFKMISEKRLKSVLDAITETPYRSVGEVRLKCKALDETLKLLCYLQWRIELLKGPSPDPPVPEAFSEPHSPVSAPVSAPVKHSKATKNRPMDVNSQRSSDVDGSGRTDDESDLNDFIDDSEVIQIEDDGGDVVMETEILPSTPAPTQKNRSRKKGKRRSSQPPEGSISDTAKGTTTTPVFSPGGASASTVEDKALSSGVDDMEVDSVPIPRTPSPPHPKHSIARAAKSSSLPSKRKAIVDRHDSSENSSSEKKRPKSMEEQDLDIHIDGFRDTPAPQNVRETPSTSRESSMALEREGVIPSKFKAVATNHWIHLFKDDTDIIRQLRSLRRHVACMRHDFVPKGEGWREPWMSIYQEYIEWVELGISEETGIKVFLKWRRDGNDVSTARAAKTEEAMTQYRADKQAKMREALKKANERQHNSSTTREDKPTEEDAKHRKDQDGKVPPEKVTREKVSPEKVTREKVTPEKVTREKVTREKATPEISTPRKGTPEKNTAVKNTPDKDVQAQRMRCTTPPNTIMIDSDTSDSDSSNIQSPRRRIGPKPRKFFRKDSISEESETPFLSKMGNDTERPKSQEGTNPSTPDEDEDMPIRRKSKKRTRRKYFGDSSESESEGGGDEDDEDDEDDKEGAMDDIALKGKKKARVEAQEAEDVLRLREDLAKRDREIQERIKVQEARGLVLKSNSKYGELLINPGHKDTESPVTIPLFFSQNMKPHQIDGVRFMWRNVVMLESGCILAHAMGLGKTFQVIVFLYVLLREILFKNENIPKYLSDGRVLLLVPPIVIDNWQDEFIKWIPADELEVVRVWVLPTALNRRDIMSRYRVMHDWHSLGGILLLSYSMFRTYSTPVKTEPETEVLSRIQAFLTSPGPSITVADEGHVLKNEKAKLSVASKRIKSKARVILTGYPLQNRLEEYWCMVDFIRPNYLGELSSFRGNFISPIERGLFSDSHPIEKKASSKKLRVLTELIGSFVLRKDQSVLRASLPKKIEYVISCKLTSLQMDLYEQFLLSIGSVESAVGLLGNGHIFLTICNHPAAFKVASRVTKNAAVIRTCVEEPSNAENGSTTTVASTSASSPGTASGADTLSGESAIGSNEATIQAAAENGDAVAEAVESNLAMKDAMKSVKGTVWDQIIARRTDNVKDVANSYKMMILLDILAACRDIKEKVLVFTRSIPTIDLIEYSVKNAGFKSITLDGSTAVASRQSMINEFNDTDKYDMFLISTGAGSVGVNLVSASRVVIFDVGWNPSHDEQAIARAFRYGQTRKVFVYRLQTFGTFEDLLYKNNLHKLGLANRVVDKKTIKSNTFSKTQMKQYFQRPPLPSETPVWATKENIDDLFSKPDTEDSVLRAVIEKNKESLTVVVPQNELIRELDSDLTEADMEDIRFMITQEKRRIEGKPFEPAPIYAKSPSMVRSASSPFVGSPIQPSNFPVPGDESAADALKPYRPQQKWQGSHALASGAGQGPTTSVAASKEDLAKQKVSLTRDELQALLREHQMAMSMDPTISRAMELRQQQLGRPLTSFEREQEWGVLVASERIRAISGQHPRQPQTNYIPGPLPPYRNEFRGYTAATRPERMAMPAVSQTGPAFSSFAYTVPPTPAWAPPSSGSMNNVAVPGSQSNLMTFPPISSLISTHQQLSYPTIPPQHQLLQHQEQIQGQDQRWSQSQNQGQNQIQDQRWYQMRDQIQDQMQDQMQDQVQNQIQDQIQNQIQDQIQNQIQDQIQNQIQDQIQNQSQNQSQVQGQSESHGRGPIEREEVPDQGKD